MSRVDFMMELESLLLDISIEEKQEALQYYNDYFEDAGKDYEDEIMKELVSPQRIAAIIKAELNINISDNENRGYFTEKGYEDTLYKDPKYEIIDAVYKEVDDKKNKEDIHGQKATRKEGYQNNYYNNTSSDGFQNNNRNVRDDKSNNFNSNTRIVLIIILCLLAIPVGIPLFFSVFGVAFGLVVSCIAIFLSFGISGIVLVGVGIALFFAGIFKALALPFIGVLFCGVGLILFGLGTLMVLLSAFICKTVIPAIIRGVVNLCRLPFKNRSVTA